MLELGPTRYATTADGLSIAYKQWGQGGRDIVLVPGTMWHSELIFELAPYRRFAERLGTFARVISFDKRGTGLSDRHLGTGSLDDRILDVSAVMDDAGVSHATILGASEGATMGALVAASLPARVDSLVLAMGLVYGPFCAHHPKPESGRRFGEWMLDRLGASWGTGQAMGMWVDGPGTAPPLETVQRLERYMFTPRGVVEVMARNMEIDVRPVLPVLDLPTLVVHATGDSLIPVVPAREAAAAIPHAKLVELDVGYHMSWEVNALDPMVDVVEEWLTGRPAPPPTRSDRVLATVLFTDVVGSTALASQLGDAEWRNRLDAHDAAVQIHVDRHQGRLIKKTGDGVLVTFDGPTRALDCAVMIRDDLKNQGLHTRAGVHTGEIELRGNDVAGLAVHIAARVMGHAADDEIWVSPTVPGLVVGSGHTFEQRGTHTLKGIPGEWTLAAVDTTQRKRIEAAR